VVRSVARATCARRESRFSDRYMEQTLLAPRGAWRRRWCGCSTCASTRRAWGGDASAVVGGDSNARSTPSTRWTRNRILRSFLSVVLAMLRTNYYIGNPTHRKPYVSFKLDPTRIPLVPLPKPKFRDLSCTRRGSRACHLRGGSVARGGLRWSDRREDFRTEVPRF